MADFRGGRKTYQTEMYRIPTNVHYSEDWQAIPDCLGRIQLTSKGKLDIKNE